MTARDGVSEFISEAEVADLWPILPLADLKRARRKREIAFYRSPIGPHYKVEDVEGFIDWKYRQEVEHDGRSKNTASIGHTLSAAAPGAPVVMTPEIEALAEKLFERRTSLRPSRPSSRSRPSSP